MSIVAQAITHAKKEYPKESCGVVVVFKGREIYKPCRNISEEPTKFFIIHPEDYAEAEDMGQIIKIVHSHPSSPPTPSQSDLVNIELLGLPWLIVSPITGGSTETPPNGYIAPLVGRSYVYGTLDCFSIIRDYYSQELNIHLPDRTREGKWWEQGKTLFLDLYRDYGFHQVDTPKPHDLILMYNGAKTPNHFGVYLGDSIILHHVQGRLSSRDAFLPGSYWYEHRWGYLRHVDLM